MNKVLVSLLLTLGITGLAQAAGNSIVGDAAAGKDKAMLCVACHGPDGNTPMGNTPVTNWPKLAGQGQRYLQKQLTEIRDEVRNIPEMTFIVKQFNDQDLADIAAFFSSQTTTIGTTDPELAERGRALFLGGKLEDGMPACIGCHGPNGKGLAAAAYPRLSGQHYEYTKKQLTDFREGNRVNDGDAMTMRMVAAKLSNKDIEALASYIQGLH